MSIKAKIAAELAERVKGGDSLAMDFASRMQRAKEQGASFGWFHGTDSDIKSFDPSKAGSSTLSESARQGTWLTDDAPITANSYANYAATDAKVMAKTRQADEAADRGDWDEYDRLTEEAEQLDSKFYDDRRQGQNIMPLASMGNYKKMDAKGEAFNYAENDINDFIAQARSEGYDGVDIANLDDAVGRVDTPANHRLVFEPSNIRSVNAAFDPKNIGSSNILGQATVPNMIGGAGLGLAGLLAMEGEPLNRDTIQGASTQGILGALSPIADAIEFADENVSGPASMLIPTGTSEYIRKLQYGDDIGYLDRLFANPLL